MKTKIFGFALMLSLAGFLGACEGTPDAPATPPATPGEPADTGAPTPPATPPATPATP